MIIHLIWKGGRSMNDERRKILKMVEDGIISSEEAEELLDSLDKVEHAQSTEISKQVDWEEGEKYYSTNKTGNKNGKKAKLLGFIEDAFSKIKNVDLDFNFGSYTSVSHIFHSQDADFSKADIDISNGSVTLLPWDEQDIRIECEVKVYQEEDRNKAREKFLEEAEYRIEDGVLYFNIPSKQMKATIAIKVPSKLYDKITIRLFNGPVHIENMQANQLRTKTTNGAIDIEKVQIAKCFAETANGMIKVSQALVKEIEAETISGSVRLDGEFKHVDAQVVNGSVHCLWNGGLATSGFFKTTTGSVRLTLPQQVKIDGKLETNIGAIHCDLNNQVVFEEKKEMMKRMLQFEANGEYEQLLHLEAETRTGSIWVLPND